MIRIKTFSIFAATLEEKTNSCQPVNIVLNYIIMKKFMLLFLSILLAGSIKAQDDNLRTTDVKSGKEILIGSINREGLISMGDWFYQEYNNYHPDSAIVAQIRAHNADYPYVFIVLGTWCGDSREQVPRFLKIMDALNYPSGQIFMVAVDRDKKAGNFCIGDFNITLVPTFIMSQQGDETGRIIETPVVSLEQDFLNILTGRIAAPEGK